MLEGTRRLRNPLHQTCRQPLTMTGLVKSRRASWNAPLSPLHGSFLETFVANERPKYLLMDLRGQFLAADLHEDIIWDPSRCQTRPSASLLVAFVSHACSCVTFKCVPAFSPATSHHADLCTQEQRRYSTQGPHKSPLTLPRRPV